MTRTPLGPLTRGLRLALCAVATLALAGSASHQRGLVLRVSAPDGICKRECCMLRYELLNEGDDPMYVRQWPGLEFSATWTLRDGSTAGVGLGSPSTRTLERKYFIELKPGEALIGRAAVGSFPKDAVEGTVDAQYRCVASGQEYGIAAFVGRVEAVPVRVTFR